MTSKFAVRLLSVAEIFVSFNLIIGVLTNTLTVRDVLIFSLITMLFCMTSVRHTLARKRAKAEQGGSDVQFRYDEEKFRTMKEKMLEEDASEYETHPINVHEYAGMVMRGEINLEDIPSTQSRASQRYFAELSKASYRETKTDQIS